MIFRSSLGLGGRPEQTHGSSPPESEVEPPPEEGPQTTLCGHHLVRGGRGRACAEERQKERQQCTQRRQLETRRVAERRGGGAVGDVQLQSQGKDKKPEESGI